MNSVAIKAFATVQKLVPALSVARTLDPGFGAGGVATSGPIEPGGLSSSQGSCT